MNLCGRHEFDCESILYIHSTHAFTVEALLFAVDSDKLGKRSLT